MLCEEDGREKYGRSDVSFEEWLNGLSGDGLVMTNIMPESSLGGFKSDFIQRDLGSETLAFSFRGQD